MKRLPRILLPQIILPQLIFSLLSVLAIACTDNAISTAVPQTVEITVQIDATENYSTTTPPTYSAEIYLGETLYLDLGVNTTGKFIADIPLSENPKVLVWADFCHNSDTKLADNYYNTLSLRCVALNKDIDISSLPQNRNSYSASCDIVSSVTSLELTKAVARLVATSDDIADLSEEFRPDSVEVLYRNAYAQWDVATASPEVYSSQRYNAKILEDGIFIDDYLFAPSDGFLVSFTATFYRNGEELLSRDFTSVPLKAASMTQLNGNFLTSSVVITVTVEDDWEDSEDIIL